MINLLNFKLRERGKLHYNPYQKMTDTKTGITMCYVNIFNKH